MAIFTKNPDAAHGNSMHFTLQQKQPRSLPPLSLDSMNSFFLDEFFSIVNDTSHVYENKNSIHRRLAEDPLTSTSITTITTVIPATYVSDGHEPFSFHDETIPYISAEKWYEKFLWWRIILVSYILILGIVGNSAIIYSICKYPRFRPQPTNIFILNMAISDLIAATFCPIVALIRVANEFYVMGAFICRIEGFVKVKPFWKRMSIGHSWIALGVIWTLSLAMGTPLLFTRELRSRKWANLVELWCQEDTKFITYYWITVCFSLIYVPIICMTFALVVILIKMDKLIYRLNKSSASTRSSSYSHNSSKSFSEEMPSNTIELQSAAPVIVIPSRYDHSTGGKTSSYINNYDVGLKRDPEQLASRGTRILQVNMKYRRHIVSILLMYLVVSAICWLPLNLSIIYRLTTIGRTFFPNSFSEFNFFCELGVATSSALNPIIFGFLSRPFRQIIKRSWTNALNILCNYSCVRNGKPVEQTQHRSRQGPKGCGQNTNHKTNNNLKSDQHKHEPVRRDAPHESRHRGPKRANNQIVGSGNAIKEQGRGLFRKVNDERDGVIGSSSNNTVGTTIGLVTKSISSQSNNKTRSNKRVTFEPTVMTTAASTTHIYASDDTHKSWPKKESTHITSVLRKSQSFRDVYDNKITMTKAIDRKQNLNPHKAIVVDMNPSRGAEKSVEIIVNQSQVINELQNTRESGVDSQSSISIDIPIPVDGLG